VSPRTRRRAPPSRRLTRHATSVDGRASAPSRHLASLACRERSGAPGVRVQVCRAAYQARERSACWRTQVCIAIPAATPALMERVEPNWAIDTVIWATVWAASVTPGPS